LKGLSDTLKDHQMNGKKLKNVLKKLQEYLIVDRGLGRTPVEGYARSLSIALRRMQKFCPGAQDI
jgi:hypothetical protein